MSKRKKSGAGSLITLIMLILVGYLSYLIISQQSIIDSKTKEIEAIDKKIAGEKKTTRKLEDEKKNVNSDEYIEKVAREEFGMVKPDEKIFVDVNR